MRDRQDLRGLPDLDAQFFAQLPIKRGARGFFRRAFAPRKLPEPGQMCVRASTADQHPPCRITQEAQRDPDAGVRSDNRR